MSITLDLSPELEAQLRAESRVRNVPVETMAAHAISAALAFSSRYPALSVEGYIVAAHPLEGRGLTSSAGIEQLERPEREAQAERSVQGTPATLPKGQRRAAIQAGRGSMRGLLSSDEFLAQRHAEAQSELEKDRQTVWPQMQEGSL